MIDIHEYELLGVIHHHGNYINSGHYTATIKFNEYHKFDDLNVDPVEFHDFKISDSAYLVFYKLK